MSTSDQTQNQHAPTAHETPDSAQASDVTSAYAQSDAPLAPLKSVGDRYHILGEIARGGMGVVLRAHDNAFGRTLAIKVLRSREASSADAQRRFVEEAKITGQLQHPGIPPAHEVGRLPDGRPFFSMKLIEGRTLSALLEERASPQADLPRFLKVFEQVAQTMGYAHAQGVIHRDLKPLNVMVGAFGEVQVMDWGLAKRLSYGAERPETPIVEPRPPSFVDNGLEQTFITDPETESDRTRAGEVLGTFAYMSPEQARGNVAALGERCDVFGLGAILCTILTGAPPYRGDTGDELWQKARLAELSDAWSRLDASRADPELVALAKQCLAERVEDRPQNAGQVADRMARYLASMQEKLHASRVARAEAEVKAQEERKRRRLAVWLGLAVIVLILGASGGGWWYVNDQARRDRENAKRGAETAARADFLEREVTAALDEATRLRKELHERLGDPRRAAVLLSELHQWQGLLEAAQAAWRRADTLTAGGKDLLATPLQARLADLGTQLQADERDRQLAFELDRIRLEASTFVGGKLEFQHAAPKFAQAFRDAGFHVAADNIPQTGAKIKRSPIRLPLAAGLDFWAVATSSWQEKAMLLELARAADPDDWRNRFRQVDTWKDPAALKQLADTVDITQQSPQLLTALGRRLAPMRGDAESLLRRALVRHPNDFWLSFELGMLGRKPVDQIGAFRAALAVRPDSSVSYYNLGVLLQGERQALEAIGCYQKAVELNPQNASAWNNLAFVLDDLQRFDEAIAACQKAIAIPPPSATAYAMLAGSLINRGRAQEAVAACKTAVEIDPNSAPALNNLGTAYRQLGQLDEAIDSFRQLLKLHPQHEMGWCNLGHALVQHGRFSEGLDALKQGHELGSGKPGWPYPSAQWIKDTERYMALDAKLPAVLKGDAAPANPAEQLGFAQICLKHRKRYAAAVRFYTAAFKGSPFLILPNTGNRYEAARAAVLAAEGRGIDADETSAEMRATLRKQAMEWLSGDLTAWSNMLTARAPASTGLADRLRHWQTDPDLAGVREDEALKKLPMAERDSWRQFWTDVAALRKRAEQAMP